MYIYIYIYWSLNYIYISYFYTIPYFLYYTIFFILKNKFYKKKLNFNILKKLLIYKL